MIKIDMNCGTGMQGKHLIVLACLAFLALGISVSGQDATQGLPLSPRFVTTVFSVDAVEKKVDPTKPAGAHGSVLVIFRTSEQGNVVDARAVEGPPELQSAATSALKQWKFKPSSLNGQPAEISRALVFDFSSDPVQAKSAKMMTAREVSPVLGTPCDNALSKKDPKALDWCKQEITLAETIASSPTERFTAHDEYGVALLYAQSPKEALDHFNQAIQLAPDGITPTDAEWGYVHWHRAAAEVQLQLLSDAEKDFDVAEKSVMAASQAVDNDRIRLFYQKILSNVLQKHAALLEQQKKHAEAVDLLQRFKLSTQQQQPK